MGQRAGQPGKEKDKLDDEVKTFDKWVSVHKVEWWDTILQNTASCIKTQ